MGVQVPPPTPVTCGNVRRSFRVRARAQRSSASERSERVHWASVPAKQRPKYGIGTVPLEIYIDAKVAGNVDRLRVERQRRNSYRVREVVAVHDQLKNPRT